MPDVFGTPEMFGDIAPLPDVPEMDNGKVAYRRWKSATHTQCYDCIVEIQAGGHSSIRSASYVRTEEKASVYLCLEHTARRRDVGA